MILLQQFAPQAILVFPHQSQGNKLTAPDCIRITIDSDICICETIGSILLSINSLYEYLFDTSH